MADVPSVKAGGQIGREMLEDSVSVVKTIRSVRGLIFFFLVLALLVPLASFAGAQFGNLESVSICGCSKCVSPCCHGSNPASLNVPSKKTSVVVTNNNPKATDIQTDFMVMEKPIYPFRKHNRA